MFKETIKNWKKSIRGDFFYNLVVRQTLNISPKSQNYKLKYWYSWLHKILMFLYSKEKLYKYEGKWHTEKNVFVPHISTDKDPFPIECPRAYTLTFTWLFFLINKMRLVMLSHRVLLRSRWGKTVFISSSSLGAFFLPMGKYGNVWSHFWLS